MQSEEQAPYTSRPPPPQRRYLSVEGKKKQMGQKKTLFAASAAG